MDLHAHISRTEIIGLLGGYPLHSPEFLLFFLPTLSGRYNDKLGELQVLIAIPCNSTSTDVQVSVSTTYGFVVVFDRSPPLPKV